MKFPSFQERNAYCHKLRFKWESEDVWVCDWACVNGVAFERPEKAGQAELVDTEKDGES
jgi:hypothetical protein